MWSVRPEPRRNFLQQLPGFCNAVPDRGVVNVLTGVIGQVALAPQGVEYADARRRQTDGESEALYHRDMVPWAVGVRPVVVGQQLSLIHI